MNNNTKYLEEKLELLKQELIAVSDAIGRNVGIIEFDIDSGKIIDSRSSLLGPGLDYILYSSGIECQTQVCTLLQDAMKPDKNNLNIILNNKYISPKIRKDLLLQYIKMLKIRNNNKCPMSIKRTNENKKSRKKLQVSNNLHIIFSHHFSFT